ncbi:MULTISPECIES: hypothetical protein [unclassified Nocardia]
MRAAERITPQRNAIGVDAGVCASEGDGAAQVVELAVDGGDLVAPKPR